MNFDLFNQLNKTVWSVSTSEWRVRCARPGNRVPSSVTWSKWRKDIGISPGNRSRDLTQQEAAMLYVRSRLRGICHSVRMTYPKPNQRDYFSMRQITAAYLNMMNDHGCMNHSSGFSVFDWVGQAIDANSVFSSVNFEPMTGRQILAIAHHYANVPSISLSTVRRRSMKWGLAPLVKAKVYTAEEVRKYAEAIAI